MKSSFKIVNSRNPTIDVVTTNVRSDKTRFERRQRGTYRMSTSTIQPTSSATILRQPPANPNPINKQLTIQNPTIRFAANLKRASLRLGPILMRSLKPDYAITSESNSLGGDLSSSIRAGWHRITDDCSRAPRDQPGGGWGQSHPRVRGSGRSCAPRHMAEIRRWTAAS